uniref:ORF26 n=1 Tax=Cydia pomonella granulosis virus TaxID=28289 RepID=A0A097P102_GVCP
MYVVVQTEYTLWLIFIINNVIIIFIINNVIIIFIINNVIVIIIIDLINHIMFLSLVGCKVTPLKHHQNVAQLLFFILLYYAFFKQKALRVMFVVVQTEYTLWPFIIIIVIIIIDLINHLPVHGRVMFLSLVGCKVTPLKHHQNVAQLLFFILLYYAFFKQKALRVMFVVVQTEYTLWPFIIIIVIIIIDLINHLPVHGRVMFLSLVGCKVNFIIIHIHHRRSIFNNNVIISHLHLWQTLQLHHVPHYRLVCSTVPIITPLKYQQNVAQLLFVILLYYGLFKQKLVKLAVGVLGTDTQEIF